MAILEKIMITTRIQIWVGRLKDLSDYVGPMLIGGLKDLTNRRQLIIINKSALFKINNKGRIFIFTLILKLIF